MLHTLNKAWIICCLNQIKDPNKQFLFVVKNNEEFKQVKTIISDYFKVNKINLYSHGYFYIASESEIYQDMLCVKDYFPIWDNILISSNIHNLMIKNFLHQHRKEKY